MRGLPIIDRELRVALRKKRPVRRRQNMAALGVAGVLLFLFLSESGGSRSAGRDLQTVLCAAGLVLILRTPRRVADLFAAERREQTLGLLYLSGLGAGEVFVSKILSSALIAFNELLALLPVLAVPFLMGGVSFDLFIATVCGLPNLMGFVLAVTLLASALTEDEAAASILAWTLLGLACLGGPLVHLLQTQFAATAPSPWWLQTSPLYQAAFLFKRSGLGSLTRFWQSFGLLLGASMVCLGLAAATLKLLWREQEQQRGWWTAWRERWNALAAGSGPQRRRLASAWLDSNPFVWFAARNSKPARLAWLIVGGLAGTWLVCWVLWPQRWPSVFNAFTTVTLLNLTLQWLIRYTAARDLGSARQDGGYELLLTTPLTPSNLVWGELEALRAQFRPVLRAVLVLNLLLLLSGLARPWTPTALAVYGFIGVGLLAWTWSLDRHWRAVLFTMWASLNSGHPSHALWRTSGIHVGWWLWIGWNLTRGLGRFKHFPTGSIGELWLVGVTLLIAWLIWRRERNTSAHWECRLVFELREIVREPLPDPDDPRFRSWDAHERFPWGWAVWQYQLHERLARRRMDPRPDASAGSSG